MKVEGKVRVWDIPVRLFHWSLVILVAISLYTGLNGGFNEMDYHMLSGYGILGLILFRVCWGFIGTTYARFSNFLNLRGLPDYVRDVTKKDGPHTLGHNPLGALSIVAFLIVLAVQAGTGLFANDDIMLEGPLTHLISDELSNEITAIHHLNIWLLYLLMGLHITAIAFHELYKKDRLILPMITGSKRSSEAPESSPRHLRELVIAGILAGVSAGVVYWVVNYL